MVAVEVSTEGGGGSEGVDGAEESLVVSAEIINAIKNNIVLSKQFLRNPFELYGFTNFCRYDLL